MMTKIISHLVVTDSHKPLYFIAAGNGVLSRLCFRFVRRWVENLLSSRPLHKAAWLHTGKVVSLFKMILVTFILIDIAVGECIPSSSQETSARSWNSCNYPWCSSRVGLSSLPQHDSPVSVCLGACWTLLMPPSSVWICNHFLLWVLTEISKQETSCWRSRGR